MRITATAEFMLEPILEPNKDQGSARDAIGLGQAAGKGLNTRHGTILTLEDISVSFDGFKALNDLNLYIGVGELRCIIGPNGAGKTTLMDVITGKTRPSHGKAWFGETLDLTSMSEVQIAQAGIGRKFQKPTVFEALSVFENLELAQKTDKSVWASLRARLSGERTRRPLPAPVLRPLCARGRQWGGQAWSRAGSVERAPPICVEPPDTSDKRAAWRTAAR